MPHEPPPAPCGAAGTLAGIFFSGAPSRVDLTEAAADSFAVPHEPDGLGAGRIAVMPTSGRGLGRAISDCLQRAANALN